LLEFRCLACLGLAWLGLAWLDLIWLGRLYFIYLKSVDGTDMLPGKFGKNLQLLDA